MQEFNEISYQNPDADNLQSELTASPPEIRDANEFSDTNEAAAYEERGTESKSTAPSASSAGSTAKQKELTSLLSGFLASLVATALVGVSLVAPIQSAVTPAANASVELLELGLEPDAVFYAFSVESDAPLDVVLRNDSTSRRLPLEGEHGVGSFEDLQYGVKYELSVVGRGLLTESKLFSKTLTLPHPVEMAYANLYEYSLDGDTLYCTLFSDSEVPLYAVLTDNRSEMRIPLENGEGVLAFPNVREQATYRFSVVGEGLYGKEFTVFRSELSTAPPSDLPTDLPLS